MEWLYQTGIILGMFILRLGVPLLITLAVGYWLRRLDARWQAEARAKQDAGRAALEAGEAMVEPEAEPATTNPPCWVVRRCPEPVRVRCPAFRQPTLLCWVARRRAEGRLPPECAHCELFSGRQMVHRQKVHSPAI